jgi:guanine deaminase
MDHPSALVDYYKDENMSEALRCTHEVIDHIRKLDPTGQQIVPILTPRSAVSCTSEFMHALGELAATDKKDLRIQTHLSENLSEIELVKKMWPNSSSYTAVYDDHNLLTERTILAHAVHLTPEERRLVTTKKAKIAHCPVSNSALASGMCPVRTLLDNGITVGLGTDISGGYSPSMLEAVRQACMISQLVGCTSGNANARLSLQEALYLATRGGAEVVGWKDRIGAFEVGLQWDAQLIQWDSEPECSDDVLGPEKELGGSNVKSF